MVSFIKAVFGHFLKSNTFQKGAALAYYAVFSILPIIIIVTSLLGLFFGEQAVSGDIYTQLKDILGTNAAQQIQGIIKNQHVNHHSGLTSIIGFVTLALSASGMFSQIHNAFNNLWHIKAKPKNSIINYFSKHLMAFLVLIASFVIILTTTALSSFLIKHSENLNDNLKVSFVYEHCISFFVLSMVFAMMFKFLGDAKVHWKATVFGGLFTALLFLFGKIGISAYIGHSHISSAFGSASVLALLLLWVYYTSQIIFLGASFVKVISHRIGHNIQPNKNSVLIKHIEVED